MHHIKIIILIDYKLTIFDAYTNIMLYNVSSIVVNNSQLTLTCS